MGRTLHPQPAEKGASDEVLERARSEAQAILDQARAEAIEADARFERDLAGAYARLRSRVEDALGTRLKAITERRDREVAFWDGLDGARLEPAVAWLLERVIAGDAEGQE
jgi:hypothetical protein